MKRLAFCLFSIVIFSSPAFAHDAKFHKGPMIEGKLLSVKGEKAQVKTDDGEVTVLLSKETKYEAGEEGTASSKKDLKEGSDVMVHGHKLDTGEFGATEVMINAAEHHDHSDHEGSDEHAHHSR